MNQEATRKLQTFYERPSAMARPPLVDVEELSAVRGELLVPAVSRVNLAMALSHYSCSWRDSLALRSKQVSAGTVALCHFNQPVRFDLHNGAEFAVLLLRNEALEHVREESREDLGAELQAQPALDDLTLRHLTEVLVREKRDGFPNGLFFLDGIATALASHLVRHYSIAPPVEKTYTGGIAPSVLRRCIEFMESHLDGGVRLNELAREAGLSASHFVRSFRRSTGQTPYQFLLRRRVARAQEAMRDLRLSLAEVAVLSGFADQHHLARIFRRITGLTPSSYRRSL
jgi:AraC family transcriptional regulator